MEAIDISKQDLQIHEAYVNKLNEGVDIENLTKQELFHHQRRLGIGGSDVAAILGINKFKTPYKVWLEKTGREAPEDLSDNEFVHFGNVLEDTVAQEYARRTGQKVQRRNKPFFHPEMPWLAANIDRHIVGAKKGLECKTADKWASRENWGSGNVYQHFEDEIHVIETCDEVPETYMLQELHYMIVLNKPQWDLAVLIGGNEFRIYTMDYNPELAEFVCRKLHDFWFNHVIADEMPQAQTLPDLESMFQQDNGQSKVATPEIVDTFRRFKTIKEQIKALETEAFGPVVGGKPIGGLDMKIKGYLGEDAELLLDEDGKKLCSWKTQSAKRIDTTSLKKQHPEIASKFLKTTDSRVFRA